MINDQAPRRRSAPLSGCELAIGVWPLAISRIGHWDLVIGHFPLVGSFRKIPLPVNSGKRRSTTVNFRQPKPHPIRSSLRATVWARKDRKESKSGKNTDFVLCSFAISARFERFNTDPLGISNARRRARSPSYHRRSLFSAEIFAFWPQEKGLATLVTSPVNESLFSVSTRAGDTRG
jgi:hypothetical protein